MGKIRLFELKTLYLELKFGDGHGVKCTFGGGCHRGAHSGHACSKCEQQMLGCVVYVQYVRVAPSALLEDLA